MLFVVLYVTTTFDLFKTEDRILGRKLMYGIEIDLYTLSPGALSAVSYTHLDVYKRQIMDSGGDFKCLLDLFTTLSRVARTDEFFKFVSSTWIFFVYYLKTLKNNTFETYTVNVYDANFIKYVLLKLQHFTQGA